MNKSYYIDMTEGSVMLKMLIFALPLMASGMLQLVFNISDVIIVGRFAGENCLAAVGSTTALCHLITNTLIGLSVGANVVTAKAIGARQYDETTVAVCTSIATCVTIGVIMGIIGLLCGSRILILMGTPDQVFSYATSYITIIFAGTPMVALFNFCAAILKAKGDTRHPLYYLLFSGTINVCLNLLFVIRLNMDVRGVAFATVIAQTISALLSFRCLLKEKELFSLKRSTFKVDRKVIKSILFIGIPASVQGILIAVSNMVVQSAINSFGSIVMAGSAASNSVEHFAYTAINCFSQAGVSFISQNIGAGKKERIQTIMHYTVFYAFMGGLIVGGLLYVFGKEILALYTTNSEVIKEGLIRMSFICMPYCIVGIMDSLSGVLRGMGYSTLPAIVALLGTCGFRVIWIAFIEKTGLIESINMVYMAFPLSWVITLTANYLCYRWALKRIMRK